MKLTKLKPKSYSRGFTLIETLFAILIFSSALTAILVVSGGGISNASFAKNQLTASFLAQEGIEMVRNIRDTEIINGTLWSDLFSTGGTLAPCSGGCIIDPLTLQPATFIPPPIPSPGFSRWIIITSSPGIDDEKWVRSGVAWYQGSSTIPHTILYVENLFNWQ